MYAAVKSNSMPFNSRQNQRRIMTCVAFPPSRTRGIIPLLVRDSGTAWLRQTHPRGWSTVLTCGRTPSTSSRTTSAFAPVRCARAAHPRSPATASMLSVVRPESSSPDAFQDMPAIRWQYRPISWMRSTSTSGEVPQQRRKYALGVGLLDQLIVFSHQRHQPFRAQTMLILLQGSEVAFCRAPQRPCLYYSLASN